MSKNEILKEIQHLPAKDKIWLVEETLKSLRKSVTDEMSVAADDLVDEYPKKQRAHRIY